MYTFFHLYFGLITFHPETGSKRTIPVAVPGILIIGSAIIFGFWRIEKQ